MAFKEAWLTPTSPTFGNAYQSALTAGFPRGTALRIVSPSRRAGWVAEIMQDREMTQQAEKNIKRALTEEPTTDNRERIWWDASKFIVKTLAREKYAESISVKHSGAVAIGVVELPMMIE